MAAVPDKTNVIAPEKVWAPAETLPSRVRRLREQYWSFYEREYTNEVRSYTTGTPWDTVYSVWNWTNVPEVALFQLQLLETAVETRQPMLLDRIAIVRFRTYQAVPPQCAGARRVEHRARAQHHRIADMRLNLPGH